MRRSELPIRTTVRCACFAPVLWLLLGCANLPHGPYTTPPTQTRSPLRAERLTQAAAELMDDNPERAGQLLRDALTADLFYGPAHNNLGVLHLKAGRLYEAANEFEWSRKLLPGHPDPRLNLALTMEMAGRIDEAIDLFNTALEVHPDHVPTMQAMVRCQLRHQRPDDMVDARLARIALAGENAEWRDWAREQRVALSH